MMDYIDKKMNKDAESKPAQRTMTAEDELYIIPDSMVGSSSFMHAFMKVACM
jgi:hypothetical protein